MRPVDHRRSALAARALLRELGYVVERVGDGVLVVEARRALGPSQPTRWAFGCWLLV
jgi:hypothetical protein